MKTVTLFRHAKSGEKDNPNIDDFDRPLSEKGLKTAPKIGAALRERGLRPNLVLCSPSVRTRQTLTLAAAEAWDNPPRLRFDQKLYEASASILFKALNAVSEDVAHVMIVGHNPGLQDLAAALIESGSAERKQLKASFPPASVAHFACGAERWAELAPGCGDLRFFLTPNTL
jgi:phosphohistidine phosphatase